MSPLYVRNNGSWVPATPHVKDGGFWKEATAYVKDGGFWKLAAARDTTPPPVPTLTVTSVNNRYISVAVAVGDSHVEDLVRVRVLVSETAFPSHPAASTYVTTYDTDYPNEPWSDWDYTSARNDSTLPTTKEWPPNPSSTTVITANKYYYFSAFAQDEEGNWSAPAMKKIFITPVPTAPGSGDPGDPDSDPVVPAPEPEDPYNPPVTDPTDPAPTTPTVQTYTREYPAKWSRSWYGDGTIFSDGELVRWGPWPDGKGQMKAAVGFPYEIIQRDLTGATVKKVELRLHSRKMYYDTGFVRYRWHSVAVRPASFTTIESNDFGTWIEVGGWADDTTRWRDISDATMSEWKTGKKTGIWFSANSTDKHQACTMAGASLATPPMLRITFTK